VRARLSFCRSVGLFFSVYGNKNTSLPICDSFVTVAVVNCTQNQNNKAKGGNTVKKFVMNVVVMFAAINAAWILGTVAAGKPLEFNFLFNIITPIICGFAVWGDEHHKAKMAARMKLL